MTIHVIDRTFRLKKRSDTFYTLNGIYKKTIKITHLTAQQYKHQSDYSGPSELHA